MNVKKIYFDMDGVLADFDRGVIELAKAKQSLAERKIIERAKGIVMEQMKLTEPQAMKFLQEKSKNSNRKLVDTAKYVIDFFSGSTL